MADMKEIILGVKGAKIAFGGLDKVLSSIADTMEEAFSVKGFEDYKDTVTRFGKELADSLLTLELRFGRMKYAIAEAAAPIATVFVPWLNTAMQAVIRFSGYVGQFLRGLFAGITGNSKFIDTTKEAVHQQEKLGSAAKAAGRAAKRTLASFDELQRLSQATGSGGGSGGGTVDLWGGFEADPISPKVQMMVNKVLALLKPLMEIDWKPLQQAMQTMGEALRNLAQVAGEALSFLWYEVLTPFAAWVAEVLAPVLTENWAACLDLVAAAMEPMVVGLKILWEALKPVVAYIGENVVSTLRAWQERFQILTQVLQEKRPVIVGIFQNIAQAVRSAWGIVSPILTALGNHFSNVFNHVSQVVGSAMGYVLDVLQGVSQFLAGAFSGSWSTAWSGAVSALRSAANGIISLINSMISRVVSGLNSVVGAANRISFTVPQWVPGLGGRHFGVHMGYISTPQIPYLAQGAVLPAGKPFLAMVGDQRHGTNVEAPLSTIQEAVASVMEDQAGAILQGFGASLEVQREILQAVLGISVGDDVIGRAAERYRQKMAVVRGG